MTKDEILNKLPNFYGTENYHRWSVLFRNFVLTDGAKFIADECGAYWLMDAIASYLSRYRDNGFAVAELKKHKTGFVLTIEDGDYSALAQQPIEYSDFPLDEITLFVCQMDDLWVIMRTSEY